MFNAKASEQIAVVGVINPVSQAAGSVSTGWIDLSKTPSLLALIQSGVLGASATLDAKFEQAKDSSGTGIKDVTGKAITQIVKASGDNKQAQIDLRPGDVDVNGGFNFVRLTLTVATAASLVSAIVIGINSRYSPGADVGSMAPAV